METSGIGVVLLVAFTADFVLTNKKRHTNIISLGLLDDINNTNTGR